MAVDPENDQYAAAFGGHLGAGAGRPLIAALMLGTFASTIANTLVNVPLAAITESLSEPLTSGTLVVVAFNLSCAVGLPFAGWLGDRLGRRRVFLIAMAGVSVGALGAAVAPNLALLITFRLVQGCSGALVLPTVLALLTSAAGPGRRGQAVSWWAAANGAGQAAGPTIGGLLADELGWRSVFLVIMPFALTALLGGLRWIPRTPSRVVRLEAAGATTLAAGVALVLAGASAVSATGLTRVFGIGALGLAVALLVVFLALERRSTQPFVSPRLLADPRFLRSASAAMCQMFCLTATLLTVPLYLTADSWDARAAGLLIVPLPLAMTVFAPVAGLLTERWSPRRALRTGLVALGLAELALAGVLLTDAVGPVLVTVAACVGAGMALTQTPAAAGATRSTQEFDSGTGLGVFNMLRFVGAALGGTVVALILGDHPSRAWEFSAMAGVCAATALLAVLSTFVGRVVPR
ncbi:MFS transporter [Sciscionella marina]|uniref:MFS transporter n=1 Tax=Sciscionella marina TaxID=508770 RepID=UPI00036438FB|nr:MFS transporter [Sciscionella marina]